MDYFFSETLVIEKYKGIHLLQDHIGTNYKVPWDDFGFIIKFQVYFVGENGKKKIGDAKFLSKEEPDASKFFKSKGIAISNKIYDIKESLDAKKIVSLGLSINYYKVLGSLFDDFKKYSVLRKLCDIGCYSDDQKEFSNWEGYSEGLMRGSSAEALMRKGYQVALGRYEAEKKFSLKINSLESSFEPIDFNFDVNRKVGKSNISLLIGKNGVGKSHILKKLSEIVTGIDNNKVEMPYFHKLIVMSYSPFETFYTKDEILDELSIKYGSDDDDINKKSAGRRRLHVNEYSYIGFRNNEGDFDPKHPKFFSAESIVKIAKYDMDNSWWIDKKRLNILIDTLSLGIKFDKICIYDEFGDEIEINEQITAKIIKSKFDFKKGVVFKKNGKEVSLSSGQRIYAYMLPAIVAEIEEESLLVLDEPELYLHPELEVGLIEMLQNLLNNTKSFAIIATHSSIITREVEKNSVVILRKDDGHTRAYKPTIETYGESIDLIISEVFDDEMIKKPYQIEIDNILKNGDVTASSIASFVGDDALTFAIKGLENDFFEVEDE
ncbi:AAA family ATPase [Pantoea sp. Taur]|uniref:AAA family ATPase n=1 Tax=Pantoea sp. Taur TaxID=2576757 RepID=UPI001353C42B|nr:AAA family ATPase [Pantoea sp. Taur]MXP56902.1 ATP-binding protein [Pantoea sp. Taur]